MKGYIGASVMWSLDTVRW